MSEKRKPGEKTKREATSKVRKLIACTEATLRAIAERKGAQMMATITEQLKQKPESRDDAEAEAKRISKCERRWKELLTEEADEGEAWKRIS
jgi:hypothetical protein